MLNLLPFPILDGGMILLLLIESALRHDINLVIKERIYTAAFVVLMAFFAFIHLQRREQAARSRTSSRERQGQGSGIRYPA